MENWQLAVVEKQQLLNGKIERLIDDLSNPEKSAKLESEGVLLLLTMQLGAMKAYNECLLARIALF
jgi:hypothetical protein